MARRGRPGASRSIARIFSESPPAGAQTRSASGDSRLAPAHAGASVALASAQDEATRRLYIRIELSLRKVQPESLAKVAGQVRQEHDVQVAKTTLHGSPAPALARYVRDVEPEIVVMTTHRPGGLRRAWLGSVADQWCGAWRRRCC